MSPGFLAPEPDRPVAPGPVPTFSVVIPAYQVAHLVGEAVESALGQTLRPHEVVVCNDGSTDDIHGALAPYRDRILLVCQENRGLAAAKNAAVRAASGDFVAVLDADDAYMPQRLEALGQLAAARPDLDILASDVYVEADGETVGLFYDPAPFVIDDQRLGLVRRNFIWSGSAVRRERLLALGGFDESIDCADDWDCWLRLVFDGSKIGCVDEPLAYYRLRPDAMTATRSRDFAGRLQVLRRVLEREGLSHQEREVARAGARRLEPRLLMAHAQEAIAHGLPSARRLSLTVARNKGIARRTRIKAALAALAPSLARRVVVHRAEVERDPRLAVWNPDRAGESRG